ncbi:hypothetical protein [Hoeflea ulvae]|uniref:Curlin n=1 Tax=Hoeflea ulvae TaxID=2983764 RepID=A0ABT3YDS2_9HYPH|nr:hypothetical protein [Hoeflea ulvae]MCY0094042.1 hypothetical protein [Hoeflea ulvae]
MVHRKYIGLSLGVAALLAASVLPSSANQIDQIQTPATGNELELLVTGDDNMLSIEQIHDSNGGLNQINLEIVGNANGGFGQDWNQPLQSMESVGLQPGTIIQEGHENLIDLQILGSSNLFAAIQRGSGNTLSGTITGSGNQVASVQLGTGNSFAFSQTGNGNSIAVFQKSW